MANIAHALTLLVAAITFSFFENEDILVLCILAAIATSRCLFRRLNLKQERTGEVVTVAKMPTTTMTGHVHMITSADFTPRANNKQELNRV